MRCSYHARLTGSLHTQIHILHCQSILWCLCLNQTQCSNLPFLLIGSNHELHPQICVDCLMLPTHLVFCMAISVRLQCLSRQASKHWEALSSNSSWTSSLVSQSDNIKRTSKQNCITTSILRCIYCITEYNLNVGLQLNSVIKFQIPFLSNIVPQKFVGL